jgi:hypothetical protein
MANTGKGRRPIKPGAGQRIVDGKNFRLADEVRYILGRAAEHDGRVITIGQIILFSTETGDAWLIEPSDQLAARLARDGDPEPFHIEENETTFTIDWKGALSHRGRRIRLHGSRNRAARHDPRLSNAQTNSEGMMLKISNIFG